MKFLATISIGLVLAVLAVSAFFLSVTTDEKFPIIDAHLHTDFTGEPEPFSGIPMTLQQLLSEFGQAGVVGGIAHSERYDLHGYTDLREHNIHHCAGVDKIIDTKRLENGLRKGIFACIKVYLGYVYQHAHSPNYFPAYKLAEKYGVPVVFHTGDTYSEKGKLKYANPLDIDEVAVMFPNVKFVIAHMGNPWVQTAAEVIYKNPNVYGEASAMLIGDVKKVPRDEVDELMVKPLRWAFRYIENPSKLMFGTDWPLTSIGPFVEAYKRAIPKEHWKKVFYENAQTVFPALRPTPLPLS